MKLYRTSAPATTPIALADLKEHLRIGHNQENALLALHINAATEELDGPDGILRRALITQTWQLKTSHFPRVGHYSGIRTWQLPIPPLQSVTSITYYDEDNTSQTYDSANYTVHTPYGAAGIIELKQGYSWPNVYDREDAITITFVAGYGDAATDVPEMIRRAALIIAARNYTNRGDMETNRGIDPNLLQRLVGPYMWRQFA